MAVNEDVETLANAMQYDDLEEARAQKASFSCSCSNGHRSSLQLFTSPGGHICLQCLSDIISSPSSLVVLKSYAVSQFEQALDDDCFRNAFYPRHRYHLVPSLLNALCASSDDALSKDLTDVVLKLCMIDIADGASVLQSFLAHLLKLLGSSAIVWTSGQASSLHCLGLMLELQCNVFNVLPYGARNQEALISNFVCGLQLPSDSIRGELLFVFYKLLQFEKGVQEVRPYCPDLIRLVVDILLKTDRDEIRTNCIAFLITLAREEIFNISLDVPVKDGNLMEADSVGSAKLSDSSVNDYCFAKHFAEAVKGPLLSSDAYVQIGTLELICYACATRKADLTREITILVEDGITDYIFEIIRLSDIVEPVITWSVRALNMLSAADQAFMQRFSVGFSSLIRVLDGMADLLLYHVQKEILFLITNCIWSCPGIASTAQSEELVPVLMKILNSHAVGTFNISMEVFNAACLTLTSLLKTPSFAAIGTSTWRLLCESIKNIGISILESEDYSNIVYFLDAYRQVFICSKHEDGIFEAQLVDICVTNLLPLVVNLCENDEIALAILQTFSLVLQEASSMKSKCFAEKMASSSWFSFSFELLAHYPSSNVKNCVFVILSMLIDQLVGEGMGEPLREVFMDLPSDPVDLLFLLGQNSSVDSHILQSQLAVISILHASCLHNERLAGDNEVVNFLTQFIMSNTSAGGTCTMVNIKTVTQIMDIIAFTLEESLDNCFPYSVETERLLIELLIKNNYDVFCARKLKVVLKWLFRHNEIEEFLLANIVNLCRCFYDTFKHASIDPVEEHDQHDALYSRITVLLELINEEDFGTAIVVALLNRIPHENDEEYWGAVLDFVMKIIYKAFSVPSRLNGNAIAASLRPIYFSTTSSATLDMVNSLVLNLLYFAKGKTLIEEDWLAITFQIMDMLVGKLKNKQSSSHEIVPLLSILTLVLQNCKLNGLFQLCRSVLSNSSVGLAVETIIMGACSRTSSLFQLTEKTGGGKILISALIFYSLCLKCIHRVFQRSVYFEDFFPADRADPSNAATENILSFGTIRFRQLSELLYFGAPTVQIIASHCMVEVLSWMMDYKPHCQERKQKLVAAPDYLQSVLTILQGLVLHENILLGKNAAYCIYCLLEYDGFNEEQRKALCNSNWYRLILEELTVSLAAPGLPTWNKILKPAAYVAIALLKLPSVPTWIGSVFSPKCIASILDNLSSQKLAPEIVFLLSLLLSHGFMEQSHVAHLGSLFMEYRTSLCAKDFQGQKVELQAEERVGNVKDCLEMIMDLVKSTDAEPIVGSTMNVLDSVDKLLLQCRSN